MRRILLAIAMLATACGGATGVDLIVTSDVPITRVEIFFATKECYGCDTVAWLPNQTKPPGKLFYMTGDAQQVIYTDRIEDMQLVMHLDAAESHREPAYIVFVGFDANDQPVAVADVQARIPAHQAETWNVRLVAADPAQLGFHDEPTGEAAHLRVHTWKRTRDPNVDSLSRCLAFQWWDSTMKNWTGLYVVPEDDPDCDGHAIECDPRYANFTPSSPQACLRSAGDAGQTFCLVGGSACADGVSSGEGCNATTVSPRICAPSGLCAKCETSSTVGSCARTALANDNNITHASCRFDSNVSTHMPCDAGKPGTRVVLSLDPISCEVAMPSVGVLSIDNANTLPTAPVMLDAATINVVGVQPNPMTGMCQVVLGWTGLADFGQRGWVVLAIKRVEALMLIPVEIEFGSGVDCNQSVVTEPATCSRNSAFASDSMFVCGA